MAETIFATPVAAVTALARAAADRRRPGVRLRVTYLRRKPGRGLVAVFGDAMRPASGGSPRVLTVTVSDEVLDRDGELIALARRLLSRPGGDRAAGQLAEGVRLAWFPEDPGLPCLSAVLAPSDHVRGWLLRAARHALGLQHARLTSVHAEIVRYKPGDRCVVRYQMWIEIAAGRQLPFVIFGKIFADPAAAAVTDRLATQLWRHATTQQPGSRPWLPRPLGADIGLGMALSEGVVTTATCPVRPGTVVLQLDHERRVSQVPADLALRETGRVLVGLHGCEIDGLRRRTVDDEVRQMRDRVAELCAYFPDFAGRLSAAAADVSRELHRRQAETCATTHGAFKPSQLVFVGRHPVLTDLDGVRRADPARDLGYLFAYLRPARLWGGRSGPRDWHGRARTVVSRSYRHAARNDGAGDDRLDERVAAYEAAILFKITTRRVHRLQAPRPGELGILADEVSRCLDRRDGLAAGRQVTG